MPLLDAWVEKLRQDLTGEDENRLADRVARWHARGDAVVLSFAILQELKAIRVALAPGGKGVEKAFPPGAKMPGKSKS